MSMVCCPTVTLFHNVSNWEQQVQRQRYMYQYATAAELASHIRPFLQLPQAANIELYDHRLRCLHTHTGKAQAHLLKSNHFKQRLVLVKLIDDRMSSAVCHCWTAFKPHVSCSS